MTENSGAGYIPISFFYAWFTIFEKSKRMIKIVNHFGYILLSKVLYHHWLLIMINFNSRGARLRRKQTLCVIIGGEGLN